MRVRRSVVLCAVCAALVAAFAHAANPVALLTAEKGRIFLVCPTGEVTWQYKTDDAVTQVGSLRGRVYWRSGAALKCVDIITGEVRTAKPADAETAFKGRPSVGDTAKMMAAVGLKGEGLTAPVYQQRLFLWPNDTCLVVPPDDIEKMRQSALAAKLVKPLKPRKILVVSRSSGYGHVEALAWGARGFAVAGEATGAFKATTTDDITVLAKPEVLAGYDAVVINNCTSASDRACRGTQKTLVTYVKSGGGVVFIHSSMDSFYDCAEVQSMANGCFCGHPWGLGDWSFVNEAPTHRINAPFAGKKTFRATDEIYMQKSPQYDRSKTHVLVSMDLSDKRTVEAERKWGANAKLAKDFPLRADRDYAVSWLHAYGRGRVFHTSFGHDQHGFLDPRTFAHMLLGTQYATGDLDVK